MEYTIPQLQIFRFNMENLIVKYYGTDSAAGENFDVQTLPKQNSLSEDHILIRFLDEISSGAAKIRMLKIKREQRNYVKTRKLM